MDQELEDYQRKNKQLALDISQLQMKQKALNIDLKQNKTTLKADQAFIKRGKLDLHEAFQACQQDPKNTKDAVASLYRKYAAKNAGSVEVLETDNQKEYNRQRDYLEKSVDSLKRKLEKQRNISCRIRVLILCKLQNR